MIAAADNHLWWYLARSSGLVAWLLLAGSVCWGLIVAGRLTRKVPPPAWNLDVHRSLGGLALAFTAGHMAALVADSYVQFGPAELLVPMASAWRPAAVTWGVIGFYLLGAIEVTSLLQRRMPRKLWRAVHLTSAPLFVAATLHGLQSGTDIERVLARATGLAALALVLVFLALRIGVRRHRATSRARTVVPSA